MMHICVCELFSSKHSQHVRGVLSETILRVVRQLNIQRVNDTWAEFVPTRTYIGPMPI